MRNLRLVVTLLALAAVRPLPGRAEPVFHPPSEYTRSFVAGDSLSLLSVNHGPFRLYFQEGSWTSRNLPALEGRLDDAIARVLEVLGLPECPRGVYLLAVDSEEEMQRLMGWHIKGGAARGHDLVFFVFSPTVRPQFKHEIFHLLSDEAWGTHSNRLLDEGGAVFTDGECFYENPIDGIASGLLRTKRQFPLRRLIDDFDACARENEVTAYLQSASIFKYLYESHGPERLRRIWTEGFGAFEAIYGYPVTTLEQRWIEHLLTVPPPADLDWKRLMSEGCG